MFSTRRAPIQPDSWPHAGEHSRPGRKGADLRLEESPRAPGIPVYKLLHDRKNYTVMQQFTYIAEIFVVGGIVSALIIATDLRACRQQMRIMNSVWILTGLWASVFGLWAYFAFGRERRCRQEDAAARATVNAEKHGGMSDMERADADSRVTMRDMKVHATNTATKQSGAMLGMDTAEADTKRMKGMETDAEALHYNGTEATRTEEMKSVPGTNAMRTEGTHAMRMDGTEGMQMDGADAMRMGPLRPRWQSVVLSTLHCGAGCTLADLVGEWFLYFVPIAIGGSLIAGSWVLDYLLALLFGIGFQYAAMRGMEPRTPRGEIVRRAAKADILSLTAWQAGMYGWMAVAIFAINHGTPLPRTSFGFWFMMQIAMACGFLLALPVNVLLIKYGVKKGM